MKKIMIEDPVWEQRYREMFRVRPYTEEERAIIDSEANPTSQQEKLAKMIMINQIDCQRYEDAKTSHPNMADHMARMQLASQRFVAAMVKIYEQDHGVTFDDTGVIDISSFPSRQMPTVLDPEYIDRPA